MPHHATWYERAWGWGSGLFVGWINYNNGAAETAFKYIDAIIMTAMCGIIGGTFTYLTRKFCVKYFGSAFREKPQVE